MALTFTAVTPANPVPRGGSSLLQFRLTALQHEDLFELSSGAGVAAWYQLFPRLTGGPISYDRSVEEVTSESAEDDTIEIVTDNGIVIQNGVQGTSAFAIKALEWLEDVDGVPVRYPLPLKADGTFERNEDDERLGQLWGFYRVRARRTNRSINTGRDQQRAMEFELVARRDATTGLYKVVYDVNIDDEAGWPAALNPFKNTPS